jgi:hypothetical protein
MSAASCTLKTVLPALGLFLSSSALAAAPGGSLDDAAVNYGRPKVERRGGFAAGASNTASFIDMTGYPNEVGAIGDPALAEKTGPSFGLHSVFWMGGAIRDFFTVGIGVSSVAPYTSEYVASNVGIVLHLEAYPLYSLGRGYRDLGMTVDAGPGFGAMFTKDDLNKPKAMGGGMSFLSASAFWEPIRFWNFSAGPMVSLTHAFSQTMTTTQFGAGMRVVFYWDQPKKEESASAYPDSLRF